jgi:glycosyltransferase involved in cell wall biosynthesis
MTSVGIVLVTHNSERFIEQTLHSITNQSRSVDDIVVIDDDSTDRTRDIVQAVLPAARIHRALSRASDVTSRIAQNFVQGVRASQAQVVVLGDHDDVWSSERVAHQVRVLANHPHVAMVASSATLIDEVGRIVPGTLRATFPVPGSFNTWPRGRQVTFALARSIATGGVSALRPSAFPSLDVPAGWLHDRWWSLTAIQQGAFWLDDGIVAQYRVSAGQEVGLETQNQGSPQWVLQQLAKGPTAVRRASQVAGMLWRQR